MKNMYDLPKKGFVPHYIPGFFTRFQLGNTLRQIWTPKLAEIPMDLDPGSGPFWDPRVPGDPRIQDPGPLSDPGLSARTVADDHFEPPICG